MEFRCVGCRVDIGKCYTFFYFKQKTAYGMRISDWSSDVCSSDLVARDAGNAARDGGGEIGIDRGLVVDGAMRLDMGDLATAGGGNAGQRADLVRSEEHTSELQSLMRISYAVFCLKKKTLLLNTYEVIWLQNTSTSDQYYNLVTDT